MNQPASPQPLPTPQEVVITLPRAALGAAIAVPENASGVVL